jgi:uncharacterized membrane protein
MTTVYFTVSLTYKSGRTSEWIIASNVKDPTKLVRASDAVLRRLLRDYPDATYIEIAPVKNAA